MTPKPPIPTREALQAMSVGELRDLRRTLTPPWPQMRKATKMQLVNSLLSIAHVRALATRETT